MYISECLHDLTLDERSRLERRLGIILRRPEGSQQIRKSLHRIFQQLEARIRAELEAGAIWQRVLEAFAVLPEDRLTQEEGTALKKHPLTFYPEGHVCLISGEALEVLSRMDCVKQRNFLFAELFRLSSSERKSYGKWLGLTGLPTALDLYAAIARARGADSSGFESVPEHVLHEVFPEDVFGPMLWYYKGVLPLYECLHMMETQTLTPDQSRILQAFRLGYLVARPMPVEFGEPQRYRAERTREKSAGTFADLPALYKEDTLQRSLF
ncbi:MAG: hypothetical protein JNM27_12885 [Leptospirales bacterium]|nr:hypothetical protein [Leptospirales bacterium]